MLKPFYIKKKNIDDRLVPEVTAADAGKALVVGEDGKITTGEAGNTLYLHQIKINSSGSLTVTYPQFFLGLIITFISDRDSEYTYDEFVAELQANGYTSSENGFPIPPCTLIENETSKPSRLYKRIVNSIFYTASGPFEGIYLFGPSYYFNFSVANEAVSISKVSITPASLSKDVFEATNNNYLIAPISL